MVEIRHAGAVVGPEATQEQSDRINGIVTPIAQVLLDLPPDDCFNVMGSLLMTYALRFSEPENAVNYLASMVISGLPEAIEQVMRAKH